MSTVKTNVSTEKMSEPKSFGERICAKLHEAGILKPFKIVAGTKIIDDELAVSGQKVDEITKTTTADILGMVTDADTQARW